MSSPSPTEVWRSGDLCTVLGEGSEVFTVTADIGQRTAMLVNAAGHLHGREGFQKMRRHPQRGERWRPREGVAELPPSYTLWRERIVGLISQWWAWWPPGGKPLSRRTPSPKAQQASTEEAAKRSAWNHYRGLFPEGGAKVTQVGSATVWLVAGAATITTSLADMRLNWERIAAKEPAQ